MYGVPPRTPEQIAEEQELYFKYMKALIEAEKLNPEEDMDGIRERALLKRVAISGLTQQQRLSLAILLLGNEDDGH
jgi:hypothetical protein